MKTTINETIEADLHAITEMFAEEVVHGTASWAYTPPTQNEMMAKFKRLTNDNYPWLTARLNEQIVGFSFASAYRPREGYRFLVEDSIYVEKDFGRHGIATRLRGALIEESTSRGYKQMVAVIGDSNNRSSISLHEQLGFHHVGVLTNVGYKFDRWLDSVLMQRAL